MLLRRLGITGCKNDGLRSKLKESLSADDPHLQCQNEHQCSHMECSVAQYKCGSMKQVIRQMKNYKVNILCISEMRWMGQVKVMNEGMMIIYNGNENHHTHRVGLLLDTEAPKAMIGQKPVNKHILTARL